MALTSGLALAPAPATAVDLNAIWPDLNLPGFKVTPFVSQRVEYESNVFQVASRSQDDVIFRTIPGFTLELPLGRHRIDLGARAEILRYVDLGDQDTEHYFFLGNVSLDFPGGLKIKLKEDFAHTSDPPGTELTGRIQSSTNTLSPSVEYAIARRFSIGFDYVWAHVDFKDTVQQLDRDEHTFGVTAYYKIQPKTDVLLNFAYGFKDFADNGTDVNGQNSSQRDVDRYIITAGIRGEITPRLVSTFRAGYEIRDADRGDVGSFSGYVAGGDLVWTPSERARITLITERSVQESVFATNFVYISSSVTLAAEYFITPKILLTGRLFGNYSDYLEKAQKVNGGFDWRTDWTGAFTIGVEYQIQKWLAVSADYTYTRRSSNFDVFDFKDDLVGAKVTLSF